MRRGPATRRPDSAFTLVELLVTIAIIGILAALLLGVAAVAAESGRKAKTKQLVTRLHTLLIEHYDSYRDRRVALRTEDTDGGGNPDYIDSLLAAGYDLSTKNGGQVLAIGRLAGAREQMKMEMPDRWSDFVLAPIGEDPGEGAAIDPEGVTTVPAYLREAPSLAQLYRLRYAAIWDATNANTGVQNTAAQITANQGAECLYMIIVYATGDGESRGMFNEGDIADTDGDGAPEFIDGWGRPIQFLRWAPGYLSELQLSRTRLTQIAEDELGEDVDIDSLSVAAAEEVARAIAADRDPQDLFRVDQPFDEFNPFEPEAVRGYRLVPLIYSSGGDEELGLRSDSWFVNTLSDPYFHDTDTGNTGEDYLGDALDTTASDNITNHLITAE